MKKVLLIVLGICFSACVFAQKIHFTDSTNVWKELSVYTTGGPTIFNYETYSFAGDTAINSVDYTRFSFGIVREDTILKKVYIRDVTNDSDIVLMDYNLTVGDTFNISFYSPATVSQYIVTGVDSTQINSTWYKVWHFSRNVGTYFEDWCDVVEGIGCIQHPTCMLWNIGLAGESADYMYCFSNRGTTPILAPQVGFLDNNTSCSTFPTLDTKQLQLANNVSVYPNPATTELTITASDKIKNVSISNVLGQRVYSHVYDAEHVEVDVSGLAKGMYFVEVNDAVVRKFVKG